MTYTNEITGVIALTLMLLVCKGFWPHMKAIGHDPLNYLTQGIFIGSAVIAMRIGAYDGLIPLLRYSDYMRGAPMPSLVEWLNTLFNTGFAIGAWRILKGLHASLPIDKQREYNWLTCAFYPARMRPNFYRKNGL